jgi:hypothetical protein
LNLEIPDTVDGSSMLGLMRGTQSGWREYVHGEHCTCYSEVQEMQYLTDGRFKYIWFPRLGTEQLFNLQEDPGELMDLAVMDQSKPELLRWRKRLISELEPRKLGLTDEDNLVCQAGKPYMVSPKYQQRKEQCGLDWDRYEQPIGGIMKRL